MKASALQKPPSHISALTLSPQRDGVDCYPMFGVRTTFFAGWAGITPCFSAVFATWSSFGVIFRSDNIFCFSVSNSALFS
jgi:hypothetical protein